MSFQDDPSHQSSSSSSSSSSSNPDDELDLTPLIEAHIRAIHAQQAAIINVYTNNNLIMAYHLNQLNQEENNQTSSGDSSPDHRVNYRGGADVELSRGATHIVGGSDGWTLFTDSTNWTKGKEFHVGDVLVFNYESDLHNVMQVNSTAYEDCIKEPYTRLFTSGSDSVVLSEVGQFWYICGVGDHCENGQKLSINVVP
ncbi:hypothetical protein ACOSP7_023866 [Xanthoceras sorbifolium]